MLAYRTEKGINNMEEDFPDFIKERKDRYFKLCN